MKQPLTVAVMHGVSRRILSTHEPRNLPAGLFSMRETYCEWTGRDSRRSLLLRWLLANGFLGSRSCVLWGFRNGVWGFVGGLILSGYTGAWMMGV